MRGSGGFYGSGAGLELVKVCLCAFPLSMSPRLFEVLTVDADEFKVPSY